MIHLFINALSASAGGGLTYVRNVACSLARREDVHTTLLVGAELRSEIQESARMTIIRGSDSGSAGGRFWYEQLYLSSIIRDSGAHVLVSAGNFALFRSPVPQILLSRNALYTSREFLRDLRDRRDYRLWIDTMLKRALAKWSVQTADRTVAPSATFAADLSRWCGRPVQSIHHGFNPENFFRDRGALSQEIKAKLAIDQGSLTLLFVSHYNYYRNFETLIRATASLKEQLRPRSIRLLLTCKLAAKENPGSYRTDSVSALVERLNLRAEVVELGAVPYFALHHLYRIANFYVTPAYAETFAHPLVEAMASGLPVVASDLPVHREICGEAAFYFPTFSPEKLAEQIIQLSDSPERTSRMKQLGLVRAQDFSWDRHVEDLLRLAQQLSHSGPHPEHSRQPGAYKD